MSLGQRLIMVSALLLFCIGTYLGTQKLVLNYLSFSQIDLLIPGEEQIPFLPLGVFIYSLEYFLPVWLFVKISKRRRIFKIFIAYAILIIIHALFYVLLPVEYVLRPKLDVNMFGYEFVWILYQIDAPINTFPSMHVSLAFLTFYMVKYYLPHLAKYLLGVAVLISFSTLVIKQHYILDVIFGVGLAWLIYYAVFLRKSEWLEKLTSY